MSEIDREACRNAAAGCVHLARIAADPQTREALLIRAQEWLKLAYAEHEAEFQRLLDGFNSRQMNVGEGGPAGSPTAQVKSTRMQQQPVQQQQSRSKPKE
jgi:hypothetical protein